MKKKLIAYLFYFLFATALLAQSRSESRLHVLNVISGETVLRLNLSGVDRIAVQTPLGPAEIIGIDQGVSLLEKGAPDVPKYAAALHIPARGDMAVEIMAAEYEDYPGIEIAPSKGNFKRNVKPSDVPFEYGTAYSTDAFFPGNLAALQKPFVWRDSRGQALWLFPVQYNPVQKVMRVYRAITVRVYAAGGTGTNELPAQNPILKSRVFDQMQRRLFVNPAKRAEARDGSVQPEKMLVIARDNLLGELEPLLTWKRQSGIHTEVVPVSAIGASGSQAVYDFVKNYYSEHGMTYLLLVGDDNAIEPEMRADGDLFACDNCFGYLDGDDYFPEVLVGRLHAATPAQLRIMINRNLEYEKHPPVAPAEYWYATALAACSNEGAGIGDDNQADWQHGNEWKVNHLSDGYEEYWEFYDGWHGDDSPTPGHYTADKPGNPTNGPIVDLINGRGVSLFNYTGHGWDEGLSSGNFSTGAAAQLRNRYRYPILIAVACSAGNFTGNNDCLGEAWQRAGDPATGEAWGGIAGFFSSDLQSWSPPMEGQDGMNEYLTDADGVNLSPTLCGMLAYGNAKMIAAYGSAGEQMAGFWNPFAEPSTVPRTRLPKPLTASHVASTPFETTSLTVHCPAEGALVSLFWQNQTWAVAPVENGTATLEFEQLNNVGPLTITVSQFNYVPYQGTITVEPAAQPLVAAQRFELDDATAGNNNQQADFGEKIALKVRLQNIGSGLASGITATLNTADPFVSLTDNTVAAADLQDNDSVTVHFPMTISDKAPNGREAVFTLTVSCNNGASLSATTAIRLNAPVLETGAWTIDDSAGGNGNGRLENGETAIFRIANRNTGGSDSPGAQGILSSDSPWLNVSDAVTLGELSAGAGAMEAAFLLSVAPGAPVSAMTTLRYRVQAGFYVAATEIAPLVVNPLVETFETNNFYSYFWQMSGNKPWQTTSSGAYSGKYCARSGTITHGQQSGMEIHLLVSAEGVVSFARRVSSEAGFDRLRFLIDDVEMGSWSGEAPWEEAHFPVSPGQHKFAWIYEKDGIASAGADRAWVDEIILPPHQIAVHANTPAPGAGLAANVSPNPTTGACMLRFDLPEEQLLGIRVLDGLGRTVSTVIPPQIMAPGLRELFLDLSACASGVYWIEMAGENAKTILRVIRVK